MSKRQTVQQEIMGLLKRRGDLTVSEAVEALSSSEATVRRHFADLASQGKLIRVYGGVRLPIALDTTEYQYQRKAVSKSREKKLMGYAAAALIANNERLFIDSGTSAAAFCEALSKRLEFGEVSDISVVTNSLVYSNDLSDRCPLVLTGGIVRSNRMDLAGIGALETISNYNFTRGVLGVDAVTPDGVLTASDEGTAQLASLVLKRSQSVIILADSSKLGKSSFVNYGRMDGSRYTVVTDGGADLGLLSAWRSQGIQVVVAK